jgi:hypothetical protein
MKLQKLMQALSVVALVFLTSTPVFAKSSFTCESTLPPVVDEEDEEAREAGFTLTATVEFDDSGLVERLSINNDGEVDVVYSPSVASEYDVYAHPAGSADIANDGLLQLLLKHANPSSAASSYVLHSITGKGKAGSLDEVIEYISDDLSGTLVLEAFDIRKNVVGRSMLVGWAGTFHNCH